MEAAAEQGQDPITSTGERPVELDNLTEQPLSSEDERIVSVNPSPDAAVIGSSRDVRDQPVSLDAIGDLNAVSPHSAYASSEQPFYYGGYDNSTGNWDGYPHYLNANGSQVGSPVIYNDNPSLMFHSGYGFNPQMAYGQYSPVATPMPSIMVDGQLYSPQQMPFSPPYYPQPVPPSGVHITSAVPVSQTEMMVPESSGQEGVSDNMLYGPGSGYVVHFGSFGGGDLSGNSGCSPGFYNLQGEFGSGEPLSNRSNPLDADRSLSPLTSPAAYAQPFGILGSYELNVGQISQQQRPLHGPGLVSRSSSRHYPLGGSYHSSNFGSASISHSGSNDRNRLTLDQSRRQERDRDSISISIESHDVSSDRNRGPRGKAKGKSTAEQSSSSAISKNSASTSGVHLDLYNRLDFVTDYESAKFFIIKSFSEDNVHRSIKYSIWASTPLGNRKLDAAYHEAKEIGNCPVFLLFSVNASAQFCGLAEMVGPVDFEKNADYWQQDRWSGQFPVQWHIIKDVPNSRFRHILLENNDKKPVTHSRDTQEVKLEQGIEMLRIFKYHDACTSILDDFDFYDERERALQERKARQQASSKTDAPASLADDSINQISDSFAQGLQLEESNKEVPGSERGGGHQS